MYVRFVGDHWRMHFSVNFWHMRELSATTSHRFQHLRAENTQHNQHHRAIWIQKLAPTLHWQWIISVHSFRPARYVFCVFADRGADCCTRIASICLLLPIIRNRTESIPYVWLMCRFMLPYLLLCCGAHCIRDLFPHHIQLYYYAWFFLCLYICWIAYRNTHTDKK